MGLLQKIRYRLPDTNHKPPRKELQLRFLHRLARLLKNGCTIVEALDMMQWDDQLKPIASAIIDSLKDGKPLDEALDHIHFNPVITSYLYFVRHNGDLETNLEKCAVMYEQRLTYLKKFYETARYPIILFVIFMFLLYFIKQSILPSFLKLFQGTTETAPTVMLTVAVIDMVGYFLLGILIILGIAWIVWRFSRNRINISKRINIYNRIPIYRQYKQTQISFLFAVHISSLLMSGLSMKDILINMARQKKQPILAHYASLLTDELSRGIYMTHLLTQLPLIDKQLSSIFQRHTDVKALEKDLSIYSELQTEETHRKIMKTITYIQPVFFIMLGGMIVAIYASLMWPMFQLIKTI
ncbi:hypothetical protein GCM10008983_20870 [Lentibacillus halophilus]|uniref:Type II secretion system protein GspF domain-containing protein n=1 Tax=Lentibacillus halophilus TaxID=295065 RepID=A0ABN0ZCM5_9BACI